jgi:Transposase DDE domain
VQATAACLSQESAAARDMLDRYRERYGGWPQSLAADNTYGNGELLQWLDDRGITPYIRVKESPMGKIALYGIEKFTYLPEQNCYVCPEGKQLKYVGINALNRTHLYYSTPLWWASYVGPQGAERSIELERKRHPAAADDHRRLESRQRTDMYPLVRRFRQTWSLQHCAGRELRRRLTKCVATDVHLRPFW